MDLIDSPMAIMESQNKNEPYTIIALTDIVSKDIRENESILAYFLRPTEDGAVMVSTYNMNNVDIDKHIKGLIAVDKEKAENVSRVGVTTKALAISIMNTLSAKQSIADLKEKYNNKMLQDNVIANKENGANKIVRGFIVGDEIHITPVSDVCLMS